MVPCRNKEAEEEASAFPHPCPDEPPVENTMISATPTVKSKIIQSQAGLLRLTEPVVNVYRYNSPCH